MVSESTMKRALGAADVAFDTAARQAVEGYTLHMYGLHGDMQDGEAVIRNSVDSDNVPEDILHRADAVIERGYNEGMVDAIARAILAERKRCADIAKLARNDAEFYGNPEMRRAASLIAHRIESGQ